MDLRVLVALPFSEKYLITFYLVHLLSYTQKEVPQHLQILLNQKPRIISSIISKNIRERLIRESLCNPCFIFWFVSLLKAGDTTTTTRNRYICESINIDFWFLINRKESVMLALCIPLLTFLSMETLGTVLGTTRAHLGQGACPKWVSCLPHMGKHVAHFMKLLRQNPEPTSCNYNQTVNGICPSPSGEARWGLMTVCGVTSFFPLGRSGWV